MRAARPRRLPLTRAVALLFVVCLAECAAEERINVRGGRQPNLVDKGSCLSYGHSCWGAHGKRSGRGREGGEPAAEAHLADWYVAKLLRKMSGADLYPARKLAALEGLSNSDLRAIFRARLDSEQDFAKLFESGEAAAAGDSDAPPLRRDADDAETPQVKAKLLQIMKEVSDEK